MHQRKARKIGLEVEMAACKHLQKCGLKLITKNYHCQLGEIDLIMSDSNTITFVEVRHRRSLDYGSALESISLAKTRKIIKTAQHFLQSKNWSDRVCCRFDIVTSQLVNGKQQLEWYKNAYSADA